MTVLELINELEKFEDTATVYIAVDGVYHWPIAVKLDKHDNTVEIQGE